MILVKLNKETKNKTDLVRNVLRIYCFVNSIKLSEAELTVLSFFIVYGLGESTKDMILKAEIIGKSSYQNVLSRLRKNGFITHKKAEQNTDELKEEFKQLNSDSIALMIRFK